MACIGILADEVGDDCIDIFADDFEDGLYQHLRPTSLSLKIDELKMTPLTYSPMGLRMAFPFLSSTCQCNGAPSTLQRVGAAVNTGALLQVQRFPKNRRRRSQAKVTPTVWTKCITHRSSGDIQRACVVRS